MSFEKLSEYFPLLIGQGLVLTLQLALSALALAVFLGLLGAWGKLSASNFARKLAGTYTTLIRGVPDIVLLLLLFYGGQRLVNNIVGLMGWERVEVNAFTAGVFSIGFIFGAYMTETFRGAILAIPRGQIEAGIACGMSRPLLFRRIVMPQMIRYALPSFGNNWLVLIKSTALVSIIGLQDMVYLANAFGKSTREPFTFLFVVAILFLCVTAVSNLILAWAERRYSVGVRRV